MTVTEADVYTITCKSVKCFWLGGNLGVVSKVLEDKTLEQLPSFLCERWDHWENFTAIWREIRPLGAEKKALLVWDAFHGRSSRRGRLAGSDPGRAAGRGTSGLRGSSWNLDDRRGFGSGPQHHLQGRTGTHSRRAVQVQEGKPSSGDWPLGLNAALRASSERPLAYAGGHPVCPRLLLPPCWEWGGSGVAAPSETPQRPQNQVLGGGLESKASRERSRPAGHSARCICPRTSVPDGLGFSRLPGQPEPTHGPCCSPPEVSFLDAHVLLD
ncbi:uncharacterized protein LOC115304340 [Suricata suricatta]|uniref:uncharacterized protein LOC115304340 n=1 Tax=Suricata suricatta TaxID=37032 RepID=UPI001155C6B6|nr:uncharacterized protein LOC115304340 [Suricata suricatta]